MSLFFTWYSIWNFSHHLELVYFLQLGNLECSVRLTSLHLKIVNLHVSLLHLVFHMELLPKDSARLIIQLLDQSSQIVFAHGTNVRQGADLFSNRIGNNHGHKICLLVSVRGGVVMPILG